MTYKILAARWGNDDRTSAVVLSEEVGHAAISDRDTPEEWAAFLQWVSYGHFVEDAWQPAPRAELTKAEKLARLFERAGVTIADLREVLEAKDSGVRPAE